MVKRTVLAVLIALALAAGVYVFMVRQPERMASRQPPVAATPPAEVGVVVAQPAEVPFPVEFAGRVAGVRDVEVRPQVSGILLKREYEEGARVKEGQVLFRIDPATYQVAQSRAEAQLAQAQAALRQAEDNYNRIAELSRRQVAAESQVEQARSQRDQASANVQLAQAELDGAKLNLSYTTVTAPVAGVTGLQSPTVGTLIQAQQTLLTTITQLDPAYVNFSFSDVEGQAYRELNERRETPISEKDLVLELYFAPGTMYPQTGRIDTAAQRVDPQTGTIQARGIFPNPDGVLLPGQFVRIRIRGITLPNAIVIPREAVSQGPQGPSIYVVGENETAQVRLIRLGPEVPAGWVVQDGLKGGEKVIVDGVIRIRPGAAVKPVPMKQQAQAEQTEGAPQGQSPGARP